MTVVNSISLVGHHQNEWSPRYRPNASPPMIMPGIASHHLLPCRAASSQRRPDRPTQAKVIGYLQFENGGMRVLANTTTLTVPSFTDCVMLQAHGVLLQPRKLRQADCR
jgi:hypothetical protein